MTARGGESATVSSLGAEGVLRHAAGLGRLMADCVAAGASINFVMPYAPEEAAAFWRAKVYPGLRAGTLEMWVARDGTRLVGTVQLDTATPPNQPHRAEVRKLMVHPSYRRRGLARRLMRTLEDRARDLGRTLITLDTLTGDNAETLYTALGYESVGVIPDFCRDVFEDRLLATTVMFKKL